MLKHPRQTVSRINHFARRFLPLIYQESIPLKVDVAGPVDRITYDDAQKLTYKPAEIGMKIDPLWATFWFRVNADLPEAWKNKTVAIRFNTRSEGLVWIDGKPYQGVNYLDYQPWGDEGRIDVRLPETMVKSGKVAAQIEVTCNGMFGEWPQDQGWLRMAEVCTFDKEAWDMAHDLILLAIYLDSQDKKNLDNFQGYIMAGLNKICNEVDPDDRTTWKIAKDILKKIYSNKNASYTHEISAIGNAHIDTAWLWPLAETKRKCSRTFSTALRYMAEYPSYMFAVSQAQQYQWMEDYYPAIYKEIGPAIKRGQWVPVGGTWVEPDCNIPSGESFVRQFLYGKRYFRDRFGWDCKEFWNPDVFGYSGQLPQIMRGAGIDYFLTQKLSWCQFNKPEHQSFIWEGIDGTSVLTHFPPADTYNAMTGREVVTGILHHVKNHQDNEHTNQGMLLFGWGDGGGGPDRHMIEVVERLKDFQGFPRMEQRTSLDFFKRLEKDIVDPVTIRGELYLEFHRGCYTSQAANKRDNRKSEIALRSVELLSSLGNRKAYPQAEVEKLWKVVLKNQFHDILPGSSITLVYEDSKREYAEVLGAAAKLQAKALNDWAGQGSGHSVVNTLGWTRTGVAELDIAGVKATQKSFRGNILVAAEAPSIGVAPLGEAQPQDSATLTKLVDEFVLENGLIVATVSKSGQVTSLITKADGRSYVDTDQPANQLVIFDDPGDAWDVDVYHLETRKALPGAQSVKVIEEGPLRVGLEFVFEFEPSKMVQRVFLSAGDGHIEFECETDWQHTHKMLKVEFPVEIHATDATYEIAYGSLKRPTHFNTPYDMGRFEVSGHRWMDLSEPDAGVALFTDSKYGYSTQVNVMNISLLRSPTSPDPVCDKGSHFFRYAIYPHSGDHVVAEVVRRAHEFNTPWLAVDGSNAKSYVSVDSEDIVIDAIKKAEDSDALVIRLYETSGCRGATTLKVDVPFKKATKTNLLEEEPEALASKNGEIELVYRPFEIITIVLD
jgi:alpha-mannosidase